MNYHWVQEAVRDGFVDMREAPTVGKAVCRAAGGVGRCAAAAAATAAVVVMVR
jgi:hypothetical protein